MLMASNTDVTPWTIIRSDNKKKARINCIKYILNQVYYTNKISADYLVTDPEIVISGKEEIELMEASNTFTSSTASR